MNTCKTCKYWNYIGRDGYENCSEITRPTDPDSYEEMELPFKVKLCVHPKLLFCERPIESNGFAVADGSTYFATLITAEDFGCIHWEKKEK